METSSFRCQREHRCHHCRKPIKVGQMTRQPKGKPNRHVACFDVEFPDAPPFRTSVPPTPGTTGTRQNRSSAP